MAALDAAVQRYKREPNYAAAVERAGEVIRGQAALHEPPTEQ